MTWRDLSEQIERLPENIKDKDVIRFDENEGEFYRLYALPSYKVSDTGYIEINRFALASKTEPPYLEA